MTVDLTLTAMGCPASDFIVGDIRERLLLEPGVEAARVNVVWDPPWTAARLTPEGRDALASWGVCEVVRCHVWLGQAKGAMTDGGSTVMRPCSALLPG